MPLALALSLALAAAAAPTISGGDFARSARPLLAKPMIQLMTMREPKRLMEQFVAAGERVRGRQQADRAAGRPARSCLPAKGKARLDLRRFVTFVERLSAADQASPLDRAVELYFPCPR